MLFVFITNHQIYQAEGGTPLVQRPMLQARGAQVRPARAPSSTRLSAALSSDQSGGRADSRALEDGE